MLQMFACDTRVIFILLLITHTRMHSSYKHSKSFLDHQRVIARVRKWRKTREFSRFYL